jgi:hypothetical protein
MMEQPTLVDCFVCLFIAELTVVAYIETMEKPKI